MRVRGFALIELVLALAVVLIVLAVGWRSLKYADTVRVVEESVLFLEGVINAGKAARGSTNPALAVTDSTHIPDRFRVGSGLVSPGGSPTTIQVTGIGTAPQMTVRFAAPIDAAVCSEVARKSLPMFDAVTVGSQLIGGKASASSLPTATDAQIAAACANPGQILFQRPL